MLHCKKQFTVLTGQFLNTLFPMFQQKQTHLLSEGKQAIIFTAACNLAVLEEDHPCGKYERLLL
jgi:hypothetical protein